LVEAFICARWSYCERRARSFQHAPTNTQAIENKGIFVNTAAKLGGTAAALGIGL
jgi:hypothetical protein